MIFVFELRRFVPYCERHVLFLFVYKRGDKDVTSAAFAPKSSRQLLATVLFKWQINIFSKCGAIVK